MCYIGLYISSCLSLCSQAPFLVLRHQEKNLTCTLRFSLVHQQCLLLFLLFLLSRAFFPTLLVLLTLAKFLVLWKELGYSQIWGLKKGLCWVSLSVWTVGVCVSSSRDCNNSWRLLFLLAQNWDTVLPLALKYVCINLLWAASDPVTTCSWPQQRSSSG